MNILEIVKKELIGKPIRICTYSRSITSPVMVRKKKPGCTDKQWNKNPEKFSTYVSRTRNLGYHSVYENTTIVAVIVVEDEYMDGYGQSLIAITESGHKVILPLKESTHILKGTLI
jgi:hypothetical protein